MQKLANLNGSQKLSKAAQKTITGGASAARAAVCPGTCIRFYFSDPDGGCFGPNGFVGQECGGKCCHP